MLIGTGTTALLAGALAAYATKRLIDSISKVFTGEPEEEGKTQIYKEFIYNLSHSISQKDILKAIVEEARDYLNCDRIVVYSLNQERYGVVVAESVTPGYTQALGKTIEDPCFEARYLQQYRNGRVMAIDDIYEAEMTPCHKEQLEQLEVKANLVTPIINEGRLFGLLVAHQCATSRQWQKSEIEFLRQLAKKVGLALENAKLLDDMVRLQTQTQTERKWTYYFTDAIQYIRQSLKQNDVLESSVEEVRRVLECDRVVVYSLNQERYGVVVAESVAPGYTRALNRTISDPCFEARYLTQYRDGRVRAIDNIYEAGMTKCYIEQLETLEVKANLVTPILNEGKLFGLLVAHQCRASRTWQDYEIRWMSQIATQVGFALDNATLLKRLKNDGLSTVSTQLFNFSLGISQGVSESQLLKIAVEKARKVIKLDRVIVYQFDASWDGSIIAESVVPGYSRALNLQIKDPCFARDYAEKYRRGRIQAISNVRQANLTDCHLEQLEKLAVKASLVVPILSKEKLFGLLIGHQCDQPRLWEQPEIDLFAQLALHLGFALNQVRLNEELYLETNKQQPERPEQEIAALLTENQAALQDLQVKISQQSAAMGNLIEQIQVMSYGANAIDYREYQQRSSYGTTIEQSQNHQFKHDIIATQTAIAEATEKVEALNKSHQNLYHMVSLIDDVKNQMNGSLTKQIISAQRPMKEITVEADDYTIKSSDNFNSEVNPQGGELVEKNSDSTPSLLLMNQFVVEITNLSNQISQQSLSVTDSFQKLAELAQQLSEHKT